MTAPDLRAFIGKSSAPVRNEVEKGAIRKFAQAIGSTNPLYLDEEYAASSRFGRLVAPPTFSRTFDYGTIPDLDFPRAGLIHGEQAYEYFLPILAGDVLYCSMELADVVEKQGKSGRMTFVVFRHQVVNDRGELVQRSKSTVIRRG
ncbi:MAG: MaoC family dehydratase N-terminal domain-containing protein [Alicyclobacillus macrosporangiidus]|uniref:MaoC family dehydratase N-terminal domain-containing protein n=1 Tax=Alicyclobacillus macrosporangiidus TaxID=392015 RepID=UPI0026EEF01C|nr:MaoC family dehydratase N-terminal domain-containing protein [Alicyclobacillus macrosporangiidus]MCL6597886.1 MaoC family dehydratase N-terminal domain-containing protein [Alicyclobacillus macrosporangiidus]